MRCEACGHTLLEARDADDEGTRIALDMTPVFEPQTDYTIRLDDRIGLRVAYAPDVWRPDEPRYRLHSLSCPGGLAVDGI